MYIYTKLLKFLRKIGILILNMYKCPRHTKIAGYGYESNLLTNKPLKSQFQFVYNTIPRNFYSYLHTKFTGRKKALSKSPDGIE